MTSWAYFVNPEFVIIRSHGMVNVALRRRGMGHV